MSGRQLQRRRQNAEIPVPPECREMIRRGALVAVNHSGGKDSQAMTILLSRIVPREQTIVVHAPLGEVEWPGTMAQIEATIPEGVPLILAPVTSGKSLLDRIEERGRFPSPSVRWGTSKLKHGPIERELRRHLKTHARFGGRLVNCLGIRRDESHARAKRMPWIRAAGVSVDRILTSQWCRCRDTARFLDLGPVEDLPALNSFFRNRDRAGPQTAELRRFLRRLPPGKSVVLVTHQVNITALTSRVPASGEVFLLRIGRDGTIYVVDEILIDPWR